MKIGVTARFLNSYFSGGLPQVALALSRALVYAGHDVTLLRLQDEPDWFNDIHSHKAKAPQRKVLSSGDKYDIIVEAAWNLTPDDRANYAKRVIMLVHAPPVFQDMESCVYQWNPTMRNVTNVHTLWTYDFYSAQDVRYLEFLLNLPVQQIPYVWDSEAIDAAVNEQSIPSWQESAKKVESMIPEKDQNQKTLSWCARIVESNFSNGSHCILPLNIVSEIRLRADPIRLCVHNAEHVWKNEFFQSNVARNLLLPDLSGNMVPRVRLPDLRRDKSFFVGHQRFKPLKSYLLDALYLGIPMIHNCELIRSLGAPYYYELNQIQQAVDAWRKLRSDYESSSGFFIPKAANVRQAALRARFSPMSQSQKIQSVLDSQPTIKKPIVQKQNEGELRIAFCDMWDDFQPEHNFFTYLLTWAGAQNNVAVKVDSQNPNLVFFGPLSKGSEKKYPGVPKVFFTGENAPPNKDADTFLNIGFMYEVTNYIRLPLWVLEINWFGANPEKIVNPRPVSLKDAMTVDPVALSRNKFCAFVATNPSNQNRNIAFQILNQWKGVDAGGRLFCNLPSGPIPAGRGGGGGEHAKIDFYKQYKFALTFENSSSPGYVTEKLFHAKVAGAVPIYWGDPFVDRDFDTKGFINANQVSTADELIQLVKKVYDDPDAWKRMASVPALSEYKKRWCEKNMEQIVKTIFRHVLKKEAQSFVWSTAESFGASYVPGASTPSPTAPSPSPTAPAPSPPATISTPQPPAKKQPTYTIPSADKRIFVTAANMKYAESAANVIASFHAQDPQAKKIVYVWPDVSQQVLNVFTKLGATEIRQLPTNISSETPWSDFWEPQHFAWKLWVHQNAINEAPADACILYLDAGTVITGSMDRCWNVIDTQGTLFLDDNEQTNARWCHPTSVQNMRITEGELKENQIWAGMVGYKKGHRYASIAADALRTAQQQRDTIVGEKWSPYSATCMGHRHDQSILSVLSSRACVARLPLREFYTDRSKRDAVLKGLPLYVHRGHYKELVPFADGIDEAYIINLERRKDRLEKFQAAHKTIKDRVYTWVATDGRALQMTKDLAHLFRNNDFKWKKSVMGCALSHMGLWEKLAQDKTAKNYLILEDDVRFDDRWLVKWALAASHVPTDADVIYLGGVLPPNKPALPSITEPVNPYFARVAKNSVFGGGAPRRYFHFCNYSYILTKRGAEKLIALVKDRGIFTSGDHMIVNHGDELLNIYFTTPLLATCFQEDDPVYIKSEFNNFNRVDNFDSDLWNNTDCFTSSDIDAAMSSAPAPAPAAPPVPTPAPAPLTHEEQVKVWNEFLRNVALKQKDKVKATIDDIFRIWNTTNLDDFNKNLSWFRIFEQLLLTRNDMMVCHVDYILELVNSTPMFGKTNVWIKVFEMFQHTTKSSNPGVILFERQAPPTMQIHHLPEINPKTMLESQWLDHLFPNPIEWKEVKTVGDLMNENTVFLVQHVPGKDMSKYASLFDTLSQQQKQVAVLHISDEYASDDIQWYRNSSVKRVIRNYWRSDLTQYGDKVLTIPLGYANGRHAQHLPPSPVFEQRPHLWAFAGSMDRAGRADALAKLRNTGSYIEMLKDNWSSPHKADGPAYNEMMQNAKFVPCFRGSAALESFRLYEAIEHGAIPIYVPSESHNCADEYKELFGANPLLGFPSWEKAAEMLPLLAKQPAVMEKHRAQLKQWWADKKAELQSKLKSIV